MEAKLRFLLRIAALSVPTTLHAAGFALLEQTGSGIGFAYAGAAASADDASAMFFNPAALSLLDTPQVVAAVHGINLVTEFQDRGSILPLAGLGALPTGSARDDAGGVVAVPNAYASWPVGDKLALGLGLNVPFGLVTDYDDPWIGRFQGLRSELKTVNVNPAIAYELTENIAIGAGLNYQRAQAELSNAVMLGAGLEGRATLDIDDDAWGWNAGVIVTTPMQTRIGLSYRSRLDYTLTGDTTVTTLAGAPILAAGGATAADVTFPDSIQLSAVRPLGAAFELRGDLYWTNWSTVNTVTPIDSQTGLPRDTLAFSFEDTLRAALGMAYKQGERWTWRAGVAWDESPVTDAVRTVRLPDGDRVWLAIGARWAPSNRLFVDAGYAHLFVEDTDVAMTREQLGAPASFASTVLGDYDNGVDIVSVQLTWAFR